MGFAKIMLGAGVFAGGAFLAAAASPVIIGASIVGSVVGLVVSGITDSSPPDETIVYKKLGSKTLAVLGLRATGKTVLIEFLTKGLKNCGATNLTQAPNQTSRRQFTLDGMEIILEESLDVPGSNYHRSWPKVFEKSDTVIYVLNAYKFIKDEYADTDISEIRDHLELIQKWRETPKGHAKKYLILGTYCDQFNDFNHQDTKYETELNNHGILKTKGAGMAIFSGSLTDEHIENTVRKIFSELSK